MKKFFAIIILCMFSVVTFAQRQQMNYFKAVSYSSKMTQASSWTNKENVNIFVEIKVWSGSYIKIGKEVIPARQVSKNNFTDNGILDVWVCYPQGEGGPTFQARFYACGNDKYQLYLDYSDMTKCYDLVEK